MEMSVIGERVRELRTTRNLTQGELAEGLCTSSMISQIETGKARPSYHMLSEIAARLEVSMEFLVEDAQPNQEYITACRTAQMLVRGSHYLQAIQLLKDLLNSQKGQQDGVPLLCDLIVCYMGVGQIEHATRLVDRLEREAKRCEEYDLLALMYQHRGTLAFQARNYRKALHDWQRALETLGRVEEPDRYLYAGLLVRLAQVHAKFGHVEESLELCARAMPYFEHARKITEQARTCLSLAKSFRQSADYRKAITFAERARHLHDVIHHRVEGERCRIGRALWIARHRTVEEAREILTGTVQRLQKLGCLDEAGAAAFELAQVHLQLDDVTAAEEAWAQAERWMPQTPANSCKLQTLQGRLDAKNHRFHEGKRRIQDVVDKLYEQRRLFEWEEALSQLAWVDAEEDHHRQACHVLLEARQQNRGILREKGICL
ncbi:helix-turn-helix transcriptional regulator [Tumebacillus sp. ITR2]|uniref:Helix-turn-helix transcriptional regulator n=1 Tax=Tumebacillus amylolyticus TaxID=2801339 RepID=A0ABS1JBL4_9BACL|nr:helix-turn-helix transcriptional regulator [Tumebacillus amylolyticus]MBL0387672.1 helix-turn-helix transcriptional regulator [Tumebacillus amylolyticus]